MIIIALSNPARDNMHDHQASAQILTGDAKILRERERAKPDWCSSCKELERTGGYMRVADCLPKMSVDEENDRGRRVAAELIENRRIFSVLSRSPEELVGILGWRIAAANGISGDLIENLRIYSGSSGTLPNGTLPPPVHNGRSSSVAVPLPVTVMTRTDRIFFSIVQQQMLSMKFLQLFVQQQSFQQSKFTNCVLRWSLVS